MNRARGRVHGPKRGMNKAEQRHAQWLESEKQAGRVHAYEYEGITLKLAHDTRYTPDFLVVAADMTIECHEVKGFWESDAKVKIKCAAAKFPYIRFRAFGKDGEWEVPTG